MHCELTLPISCWTSSHIQYTIYIIQAAVPRLTGSPMAVFRGRVRVRVWADSYVASVLRYKRYKPVQYVWTACPFYHL